MPRRWIILSLDGLALTSLGAYGSSWNTTTCLDQLAACGTLWDRVVVPSDSSVDVLATLWSSLVPPTSPDGAAHQAASGGRKELYLATGPQATLLAAQAGSVGFDECHLVECLTESESQDVVPTELEDTALAKLFAPLLERVQDTNQESAPWSLLWVHSDLLTRVWDAPHMLFPVEYEDEDNIEEEDEWTPATTGSDFVDSVSDEPIRPPALFPGTTVPRLMVSPHDHPDLITSWMNTYGCQVRLLDAMLSLLLDAIRTQSAEIGLVVLGTSGFSLGQNYWIGHGVGSLRSPDIHVPVIAYDGQLHGIRIPELCDLGHVLTATINPDTHTIGPRPSPDGWAKEQVDHCVVTVSSRADRVLTTKEWFYVQEGDQRSLYSKPDDRDDVNDIADRCRGVVESLEAHFFLT